MRRRAFVILRLLELHHGLEQKTIHPLLGNDGFFIKHLVELHLGIRIHLAFLREIILRMGDRFPGNSSDVWNQNPSVHGFSIAALCCNAACGL